MNKQTIDAIAASLPAHLAEQFKTDIAQAMVRDEIRKAGDAWKAEQAKHEARKQA